MCHSRTVSTGVLVSTENMQNLCNHHPAHCSQYDVQLFTVFLKPINKNKPAALTSYEHLGVRLCSVCLHVCYLTTMSIVTDMETKCQHILSYECIYCEEQTLEGPIKIFVMNMYLAYSPIVFPIDLNQVNVEHCGVSVTNIFPYSIVCISQPAGHTLHSNRGMCSNWNVLIAAAETKNKLS